MSEPVLIAMGGGGFSMEPENPLLDEYVLSFLRRKEGRPKVCFLPTASADSTDYIVRFYQAFPAARFETTHLALFKRTVRDVRTFLLEQDLIYVGGGNTANMLAVWRTHVVEKALEAAWKAGVVIAGVSAGGCAWFESALTDSYGPPLAPMRGLGWLPGSFCPHYDGEKERRPGFHKMIGNGLPPGWAADDGVALRFEGRALAEAVTSREGGLAYYVEAGEGGKVEEMVRPARFLGAKRPMPSSGSNRAAPR